MLSNRAQQALKPPLRTIGPVDFAGLQGQFACQQTIICVVPKVAQTILALTLWDAGEMLVGRI